MITAHHIGELEAGGLAATLAGSPRASSNDRMEDRSSSREPSFDSMMLDSRKRKSSSPTDGASGSSRARRSRGTVEGGRHDPREPANCAPSHLSRRPSFERTLSLDGHPSREPSQSRTREPSLRRVVSHGRISSAHSNLRRGSSLELVETMSCNPALRRCRVEEPVEDLPPVHCSLGSEGAEERTTFSVEQGSDSS